MSFVESLRGRARVRPRRLVFPEGLESRVHLAVREALDRRLFIPVLVGPRPPIEKGLSTLGLDPDRVQSVDPRDPERIERNAEAFLRAPRGGRLSMESAARKVRDPLYCGALMVAAGEVDGSVAGCAAATSRVIRAALHCVGLAEGIDTVSSSFYMVVKPFRGPESEVLTFSDAGVVPEPTPVQLAEIALSAAWARGEIVGDEPVVAFLSYASHGSALGPAVRKVEEAVELFREMAPEAAADGPLQADAALVAEVARRKVPGSKAGGAANVLIFPGLDAGNIAYKLVQRLAGAIALGPILQGLRRPCNDLSRGATAEDIVNVACITSLMAARERFP